MKILPSFKRWSLVTEASVEGKNLHMTHLEDMVIYGGVDGTRKAINYLRALRDTLAGSGKSVSSIKPIQISVKWDGAPAVFFGYVPGSTTFFVATFCNYTKTPKFYTTPEEVDAAVSGDLASKLKDCLRLLPTILPKDPGFIIQGDLLFSESSKKSETIDGTRYLTFHPNTIVYSVEVESDLGKGVSAASLGLVVHTTYRGDTFQNMKASYGVDMSVFRPSTAVWIQDAMYKNVSGVVLSQAETSSVTKLLSEAGKLFNQISSTVLKQIEGDPTMAMEFETYENSNIRSGKGIEDPRAYADGLIKWYEDRFDKEADTKATPKGKEAVGARKSARLSFFTAENRENLVKIFQLQKLLVEAKGILIRKLDAISGVSTFIKKSDGSFEVTGAEGYVAIDTLSNGAVKLIDRLQFSKANFDPSIVKGWVR